MKEAEGERFCDTKESKERSKGNRWVFFFLLNRKKVIFPSKGISTWLGCSARDTSKQVLWQFKVCPNSMCVVAYGGDVIVKICVRRGEGRR